MRCRARRGGLWNGDGVSGCEGVKLCAEVLFEDSVCGGAGAVASVVASG